MFKLAAAVIDFYDDPEFTKEAEVFGESLVPSDKTLSLRDVDFAVKIATSAGEHRKFPIYNKTATALSGLYFDRIAETLPEEIRKTAGFYLRAAHDRFNIMPPHSLCATYDTVSSRTVVLTPDICPAGMYDSEEVLKVAQEMFVDNYDRMSAVEKVNRASDLIKAAQAENTDITEQRVWDYAPKSHYGPLLEDALRQRETLVQEDAMLKEAFAKILVEFAEMSPVEGPFLLYHFDKIAGLERRYREGVVDPFYAAWGGEPLIDKKAEQASEMNYRLATVARSAALRSLLGEHVQAEFARDPRGAYDRWKKDNPERAKVVDTLMKSVAPGAEVADEALEAASKKTNAKADPSERPTFDDAMPNQPSPGGWRTKLNIGL